jgi:hypothetical protein
MRYSVDGDKSTAKERKARMMNDTQEDVVRRHTMSRPTLERYLSELQPTCQTAYLEPGATLKAFSTVFPELPSNSAFDPVLAAVNTADVGAALFWDAQTLRVVLPPLPIAGKPLAAGLDTAPLLSLLKTEPLIGVCMVRLGRFGVGVYQGEKLLDSKTDRRFVKGRHKKGGSSSNRFRRIREKQADELYKKVCTVLQEHFEPYERKLDHFFLGGEASTLVGFRGRCLYLKTFERVLRSRVLDIREPGHEALEKLPRTLWESIVYEVQVPLLGG